MIDTCNGLLCFRDIPQQIIRIVEPFTGEAVTVPDPSHWYAVSYCFGFDPTKGQYKIVRKHVTFHSYNAYFVVSLSLFTIGVDKNWRTVSTAYVSPRCVTYSNMKCKGGAVCWSYQNKPDEILLHARLDLATEKITWVKRRLDDRRPISCRYPPWQNGHHPCIINIKCIIDEFEDGCWPPNMDAMAHEVDAVMTLPHGLHIPRQQALQRGHLLLLKRSGALYAHKIMSTSIGALNIGSEKLLIGIGAEEEPDKSSSNGQFVLVQGSQCSRASRAVTSSGMMDISTFAYVPTVCSAPLALYFGTAMH
jgi:hypothetical protein